MAQGTNTSSRHMYCTGLRVIHLQIITEMPMMRTFRQTMMISRKVRFIPANDNSSGMLFTGLTISTLAIMSSTGESAIETRITIKVNTILCMDMDYCCLDQLSSRLVYCRQLCHLDYCQMDCFWLDHHLVY